MPIAPTYDIQITVTPAGLALGWHHMHHGGFARCLQGPYTERGQYTPADLPTVLQALIMGILEAHVVAVTPCGGILHNTTPIRPARPWEVSLNWLYHTAPTPTLGEQPPTPSMRAAAVRQCGTLNPTGTIRPLPLPRWLSCLRMRPTGCGSP
jgi:hypothetical protein